LVPAAYSVLSALILIVAFALPPGPLGLGPDLPRRVVCRRARGLLRRDRLRCHPSRRARDGVGDGRLANNLIGLAPGPFIVGVLSDVLGLKLALALAPVMALAAAVFFVLASRSYEADAARNQARGAQAAST
jgi:hypothetical protein